MVRSVDPADGATIDFGAHLLPFAPSIPMFEKIEATAGAPVHSDPEALLDVYETTSVDAAVLSDTMHMGGSDVYAVERANDALLDVVDGYDEFYGLAAVPTAAGGEQAAAELERALEAGFHGAAVETRSEGIEVTDAQLEPVFEVAESWNAPVLVHPTLHDSLGEGVLDDTWRLNATFGREVALWESLSKVIHEGVLDDYPDLDLVYHHTAGNFASMLGRIELQLERDLWPGLEATKPFDEFKAQLEDRIYVDTSGHYGAHRPLDAALDTFSASKVLFGTDFPFETRTPAGFEKLVESVDDVASPEDARAVKAGNALDLLVNLD